MNVKSAILLTIMFSIVFTSIMIFFVTIYNTDVAGSKESATIKPSGFRLDKIKHENMTYVVVEVRNDGLGGNNGWLYSFKTLNDTNVRSVDVEFNLAIGDVVTYEKLTYKKTCDSPVEIKLPDGFYGEIPKMLPKDFNMTKIPKYYTDRYDIQVDFSSCNVEAHQYFTKVWAYDSHQISRVETSRDGWTI